MIKQLFIYTIILSSILTGQKTLFAQDQDSILLLNPSFEGMPSLSNVPNNWIDCALFSFKGESPPDTQPGFFQVNLKPEEGISYLGLVVRETETWESVGQQLTAPLAGGNCYNFSLSLARSENYVSSISTKGAKPGIEIPTKKLNFTTPTVLRVWGGNNYCDKKELLAQSGVVTNRRWKRYNFKFEPTTDISYIIIEAFYKTPTLFPYNGHILVDNASAITPTPCEDIEIPLPLVEISRPLDNSTHSSKLVQFVASVENIQKKDDLLLVLNNNIVDNFSFDIKTGEIIAPIRLKEGNNTLKLRGTNAKGKTEDMVSINYKKVEDVAVATIPREVPPSYDYTTPKAPYVKETKLLDVQKKDLIRGQTLEIKELLFTADSANITLNSYPILDKIHRFLHDNPDVKIEIGGHTNNTPSQSYCDKLSTDRAQSVAKYLTAKGIREERIKYKGYGKRQPIKSNKTPEGRIANQRVEIKILNFSSK